MAKKKIEQSEISSQDMEVVDNSVKDWDFTGDIKKYIEAIPSYKAVTGKDISKYSVMWTTFSAIVDIFLQEDVTPEALNRYVEDAIEDNVAAVEELYKLAFYDKDPSSPIQYSSNHLLCSFLLSLVYLKQRGYMELYDSLDKESDSSE